MSAINLIESPEVLGVLEASSHKQAKRQQIYQKSEMNTCLSGY